MKHGMKAAAVFALAILMTAAFTAAFAASVHSLSTQKQAPRPYERESFLDESVFKKTAFGPEAQSRLREKFSAYGRTETVFEGCTMTCALTLFTEEQAAALFARRESGERSGLIYDEILFLINDTVQSTYTNAYIVMPDAGRYGLAEGNETSRIVRCGYTADNSLTDGELITRYDSYIKSIAELIIYRLSAFDAGFTLPGEGPEPESDRRFLLADNGIERDLSEYKNELSAAYVQYESGGELEAPLIVFEPGDPTGYIKMIEKDGGVSVLFPTTELLAERPGRRSLHAPAEAAEYTVISNADFSPYPVWTGAFENGGFAVIVQKENGEKLVITDPDGSVVSSVPLPGGARYSTAIYGGDMLYYVENAGTSAAVIRRFNMSGRELAPIPIQRRPGSYALESVSIVFDGEAPRAFVTETRRDRERGSVTQQYSVDLTNGETGSLGWIDRVAGGQCGIAAAWGDSCLVTVYGERPLTAIVSRTGEKTVLEGISCDHQPADSNRNYAALLQRDGFAAVADMETGEVRRIRLAALNEGERLTVSDGGRHLITYDSFDGEKPTHIFRVYETRTGLLITEFSLPEATDPILNNFPYWDGFEERLIIPVKLAEGTVLAAVKIPE